MATVITSESQADANGQYIIFRKITAAAKKSGTSRVLLVGRFPWGPLNAITAYGDAASFRSTFAPEGFDRTGDAYLQATKFPWVDLQIVRVLGATPVKATINLQKTGPANCVTATALYFGTGGNGITCVVAAATNAVANSFNLTVTKTDSATSRTTSEFYENVDSDQVAGSYWTNLTASSKLLGPLVKDAVGRPVNGTYTLASGTDGSTQVAADYLGTPGSGDKGLALAEADPLVRFVLYDDVPSGIHAAVRSGFSAHQILMTDRVALLTGEESDSEATSKTNASGVQSSGSYYVHHYCTVLDDEGTSRNISCTAPLASLASLMQPHLSPAFKSSDFTVFMSPIKALVGPGSTKTSFVNLNRGGVIAFQRNDNGTFSPYNSTATDTTTPMWQKRMRDYIALTMAGGLVEYQNGPNDDETVNDERSVVESVLKELLLNRKQNHIFLPSISGYDMIDDRDTNTQANIDAGDRTIGFRAKLISEQKRLFLVGEIGPTVTVSIV